MSGSASGAQELEIAIPILRPAHSDAEYLLHQCALAWGLAEPIVIEGPDDIRSRHRWNDRLQPFRHQVENLILFCRRLPVTLVADEVGLGKTISAGLVLAELIERRRVRRALVVAPKLLGAQWKEELESKFAIDASAGSGTDFDELVRGPKTVVITTYETIRTRAAVLRSGAFEMLILDEAHKLRNLYPSDPPQTAATIRSCLADRLFKFVLMLTATPMQNRLWDLYSLVDCLASARGLRNPFGNAASFDAAYCADREGRQLRKEAAPRLRSVLGEYICRTRRADAKLVFPQRNVHLEASPPSAGESRLLSLLTPLLAELNGLAATSLLKALVSSPAALFAQLENMSERRPHWRAAVDQARTVAADVSNFSKLSQLMRLIDRLRTDRPRDWRVIVFTERIETLQCIVRELTNRGVGVAAIRGGQPAMNQDAIDGLRCDPPRHHVVVSTDSGAEGVNLQSANVLVNVDLPWNPMRLEQRIGRVQRLGSKHASVEIVNLVLQGTFDERVLALLLMKLQTVAQSLGDIESILESLDDEDGDGFEGRILAMIKRSLAGRDVTAAMAKELASIEDARRRLKEEGELVERTLGDLRHLHRTGARPPNLGRTEPSLSLEEFVGTAMRMDGAEVEIEGGSRLVVTNGVRRRTISLDPTVSGDMLMYPGSSDFERLLARWTGDAGLRIRQVRVGQSSDAAVQGWLDRIGGAKLLRVERQPAQGRLDGELTVRASAANSFDRYEKLIGCKTAPLKPLAPELVGELPTVESPVTSEFAQDRFGAQVRELVKGGVRHDADVNAFTVFYQRRGEEEAARPEAARPERIRDEHRVVVRAEVVSLRGRLCEQVPVTAIVDVEGHEYALPLVLDAARAAVRCEDAMEDCELSRRRVPSRWLQKSAVSGRRAMQHLMRRCDVTGQPALAEELFQSEISNRSVRADQIVASAVSGRRGHRDEFVLDQMDSTFLLPDECGTSSISGKVTRADRLVKSERDASRLGLQDELVTCAVTGRRLLIDEVERSALSGTVADRDVTVVCELTGRRLLQSESCVSEVSGRRVGLDRVDRCTISGKLAAVDELVTSQVSGRRALRDHTVRSEESGRTGLFDEVRACAWTGRRVLMDELGECALTGAPVSRASLGRNGILVEASTLIARQAGVSAPQLTKCLIALDRARFSRAEQAICTRSPHSPAIVGLVKIRGFLGFGDRYVIVVSRGLADADAGECWISRNLSSKELMSLKAELA